MQPPAKAWRTTTPPAVEPISLSDLKAALGIPSGDTSQDATLTAGITTARELIEAYTNRALITQTITMQLDTFPGERASEEWWDGIRTGSINHLSRDRSSPLLLPRPRLISVTTLTWIDPTGASHVVDPTEYLVDTLSEPGRIIPTGAWPGGSRTRLGASIVYQAGYGPNASDVPRPIVQAIISHIRDTIDRPNAAISSESIDNASTVYGLAPGGVTSKAGDTQGLRGDASAMLAPYRITETGLVPAQR